MVNTKTQIKRSSDSLFTKIFARSISVYISPLLVKTKITPLQVTFLGLFFGLCAAWMASKQDIKYFLLAAILLEVSHVLDCVDGELARLTDRGNLFAANFDPISDRIKDIAILYASFFRASNEGIFTLSSYTISSIAFFSIAVWVLYMYIVDAFLNPSRKKKPKKNSDQNYRIYLGLYDLFIYGAIVFLLCNIFKFFIFFILALGFMGSLTQILRLESIQRRNYQQP